MLRHRSMKIIYEHNDEQHARHIAEHEKPKQKVTATEVAPILRISRSSPHRALNEKPPMNRLKVASLEVIKCDPLYCPIAFCGVDKRMYDTRTLRPAETALTRT